MVSVHRVLAHAKPPAHGRSGRVRLPACVHRAQAVARVGPCRYVHAVFASRLRRGHARRPNPKSNPIKRRKAGRKAGQARISHAGRKAGQRKAGQARISHAERGRDAVATAIVPVRPHQRRPPPQSKIQSRRAATKSPIRSPPPLPAFRPQLVILNSPLITPFPAPPDRLSPLRLSAPSLPFCLNLHCYPAGSSREWKILHAASISFAVSAARAARMAVIAGAPRLVSM